MGIFRDINNRKKTSEKEMHRRRWKRQEIAAKKAAKGPLPINIKDAEFFSTEMLKNKLRNPRNNIQPSGRNRKKALKRLKYAMRDEQKKAGAEKKGDFVTEFFAEEADQTNETEAQAETVEMAEEVASSSKTSEPSSSGTAKTSQPSSSGMATKKKKRGGRKKKKGKGDAEDAGDVEMKEL